MVTTKWCSHRLLYSRLLSLASVALSISLKVRECSQLKNIKTFKSSGVGKKTTNFWRRGGSNSQWGAQCWKYWGVFSIKSPTMRLQSDGRCDINPLGSFSKASFLLGVPKNKQTNKPTNIKIRSHSQTFNVAGPQGAKWCRRSTEDSLAARCAVCKHEQHGNADWLCPQIPFPKTHCGSSLHLSLLPHCLLWATASFVKEERRLWSLCALLKDDGGGWGGGCRDYVSWVNLMM